jgi:hypothetical protein
MWNTYQSQKDSDVCRREWRLLRLQLRDCLFFDATVGPPSERDLSRFTAEYTLYTPTVRLVATLLDQEGRLLQTGGGKTVFGRLPDPVQTTLQASVA